MLTWPCMYACHAVSSLTTGPLPAGSSSLLNAGMPWHGMAVFFFFFFESMAWRWMAGSGMQYSRQDGEQMAAGGDRAGHRTTELVCSPAPDITTDADAPELSWCACAICAAWMYGVNE